MSGLRYACVDMAPSCNLLQASKGGYNTVKYMALHQAAISHALKSDRSAFMTSHEIHNPFLEKLGIQVTEWRDCYVEMRLRLDPTLLNRSGKVHGGVICTMLDAAMGYSGLYAPPAEAPLHSVTLSLTSNFLDTGQGKDLISKGTVEKKGRNIYFARAEVWIDDSLLAASGVGTFKYIRMR